MCNAFSAKRTANSEWRVLAPHSRYEYAHRRHRTRVRISSPAGSASSHATTRKMRRALTTMPGPVRAIRGPGTATWTRSKTRMRTAPAFADRQDAKVVVPDLTHGLLRVRGFGHRLESDRPTWKKTAVHRAEPARRRAGRTRPDRPPDRSAASGTGSPGTPRIANGAALPCDANGADARTALRARSRRQDSGKQAACVIDFSVSQPAGWRVIRGQSTRRPTTPARRRTHVLDI